MDPDPESSFEGQLRTEVVGVIQMFYPRQNSVLILYFTLGMMGEVGTDAIDALQSTIESLLNTLKIVNGLVGDEANHQNGESKTPKKYRDTWD